MIWIYDPTNKLFNSGDMIHIVWVLSLDQDNRQLTISLSLKMSLSLKLPRCLIRYKLTDDYGVIVYSYVYDLLISKNNMKEAYTKKYRYCLSYQIKVGKVVGVNFMSHYVEKPILKFDYLKFNGANIVTFSSSHN